MALGGRLEKSKTENYSGFGRGSQALSGNHPKTEFEGIQNVEC